MKKQEISFAAPILIGEKKCAVKWPPFRIPSNVTIPLRNVTVSIYKQNPRLGAGFCF